MKSSNNTRNAFRSNYRNNSSVLTGSVLLVLSALLCISLLLQLLDFGVGGPGRNNVFFFLGNMLYTVYGFSSIIIPVFLFIAGLSCFATKWTSQKTMRLLTALVPFFTAVLTEKICRSIVAVSSTSASTVKIIITVVTGVMLIIIEILGAGVIAESVNQKLFYKDGKSRIKSRDFDDEYEVTEYSETSGPSSSSDNDNDEDSDSEKDVDNSFKYEPIKKNSIFDKSLSKIKYDFNKDESYNALKNDAANLYEANVPSIEEYEKIDSPAEAAATTETTTGTETVSETTTAPAPEQNSQPQAQEQAEPQTQAVQNPQKEIKISDEEKEAAFALAVNPLDYKKDVSETTNSSTASAADTSDDDESPSANPASIITQEEYAALISPDANAEAEAQSEPEVDELEWPDLPPAPETLPPEYLEEEAQSETKAASDDDDDDPALAFPPKDDLQGDEEIARQNEAENLFEEAVRARKLEDDDEVTEVTEPAEPTESTEPTETNNAAAEVTADSDELIEDNFDDTFADVFMEDDFTEKKTEPVRTEPVRIIDSSVHPNPAYPYGITLHDNDEPEPVQKKKEAPAVPKYPTRISLEENVPEISVPETKVPEMNIPEPYAESEKLTDMPYIPDIAQDYEVEDKAAGTEETVEEKTLDSDFFDIDMNNQPEDEELSDDIEEVAEELKPNNEVFKQIYAQESGKANLSSPVSNVFSDMEADIRKSTGLLASATAALSKAEGSSSSTSSTSPAGTNTSTKKQNPKNELNVGAIDSPELNPNANTAKNLTADELTDFFNAQQAENTPVTREIEANRQKTNRAERKGPYVIPSDLLTAYKDDQYWIIDEKTKEASINLKQTLSEFNIDAEIIGIKKGPVVTMFELLPAPGVKLSKIVALQDNIALSLAASSVRIVAPIPGKQAVGIEVPNKNRSIVSFREIIEMELPEYSKMAVPVILGKDILGKAQLIDLVKTPHMLIAGATGSGKSVCVNSLILSILYKRSYKDVKLILVDPKVVELKLYNNIPHLLTPVITEPKKALQALQYCLCEMERRYALLDGLGVRDIASYNQRIKERDICTEKLPYIVVIIDEFADLMATSGKELESIVARLTAMSRAVGIHLVLATQRPSVNVITGLIKANIPSRIAFMVASRTDSNIIIDSVGAEKLLGRGDMLYASAVDPYPVRIQGTFVSDSEVESVVEYVKSYGEPEYIDEEIFVEDDDCDEDGTDLFGNSVGDDPLYDQALEIVVQAGKASASYIQRRLKIGYNRAARLVEEMEERGIVGPANGSKPREIIHMP